MKIISDALKKVDWIYADAGKTFQTGSDTLLVEQPFRISVHGSRTYTLMATPVDQRALAIGFAYTEGMITSLSDVVTLTQCEDDPSHITLRLSGPVHDAGRNLASVSACGWCGKDLPDDFVKSLPKVTFE